MSRNGKHRNKDFTFARRLDRLMVERKLYPSDEQRLTGVHRQCIYEYVQGIKEPNLTSLAKLAHGLKVSADWLLGLKE